MHHVLQNFLYVTTKFMNKNIVISLQHLLFQVIIITIYNIISLNYNSSFHFGVNSI